MVGLIIDALVSPVLDLAAQLLPASLCGITGYLVWVAAAEGLHLDGVTNCGGGLTVEVPPTQWLKIVKDS